MSPVINGRGLCCEFCLGVTAQNLWSQILHQRNRSPQVALPELHRDFFLLALVPKTGQDFAKRLDCATEGGSFSDVIPKAEMA